jgi:hypothetical protein
VRRHRCKSANDRSSVVLGKSVVGMEMVQE